MDLLGLDEREFDFVTELKTSSLRRSEKERQT
jgi:hypothetical protein